QLVKFKDKKVRLIVPSNSMISVQTSGYEADGTDSSFIDPSKIGGEQDTPATKFYQNILPSTVVTILASFTGWPGFLVGFSALVANIISDASKFDITDPIG